LLLEPAPATAHGTRRALTEGELDVLRHAGGGLSNTEIVAALFISEATAAQG